MKRWRRITLAASVFALANLYVMASWIGAGRLTMPPRKPLGALQAEFLASPQALGMRIERCVSAKGAPYLACIPDAAAGPGARGKILRQQLADANLPLRPFGEVFGTVVLLHGWGMRKEDLLSTAERFCAAGLRCLIPDLPGHGTNPSDHTEFGLCADERELPGDVLDSAAAQFHFSKKIAALWGISMGGAYAIQAAAKQPDRWLALIVVSSFTALQPIVNGAMNSVSSGLAALMDPGLALAVRCRGGFWLGNVKPIESARRLSLPTLIVHGSSDDLIPVGDGRHLYEAVRDPPQRMDQGDECPAWKCIRHATARLRGNGNLV